MILRPWEIYTLTDPRTREVRYVGMTTCGEQRYRKHLWDAGHGKKTHCARWIRALLADKLWPIREVIERGVGESWKVAEQQWIALYRGTCDLTNLTAGGDGTLGYRCSPKTRAKLSTALKGRKCPPETLAKMSAAHKGHRRSPEAREKMSAAKKGHRCSPATRAKLAAAGQNRSPEYRAKMSAALKGHQVSPEARAKIGAAHRGKKLSAEHREHIS